MTEALKKMDWKNARKPFPEEEKVVETQTRKHIFDQLERAGIPQGSRLKFYRQAKRVVFRGLFIDSDEYDRIHEYMSEYLGV